MWNFLKGVKPPPETGKERPRSEEVKRVADKEYEAEKRQRLYKLAWEHGRPWLRYDATARLMFCTLCSASETRHILAS